MEETAINPVRKKSNLAQLTHCRMVGGSRENHSRVAGFSNGVNKTAKPPKQLYFISKKAGKAIFDYKMISDGDKVAVAVSGGKDSLSILKILSDRRSFVPIKYDLIALHIDYGFHCMPQEKLENLFKDWEIPYHIEKINILKEGETRSDISCFWCAWNRRKALFQLCDKFGCNKLALGHHKDDIAQTTLMNFFFHGNISTMAPYQELFKGKIKIIRPLAYIEEQELANFAKASNFPLPNCKCPNALTSKRASVEYLIREIEKICPQAKTNIFRALKRIRKDYLL